MSPFLKERVSRCQKELEAKGLDAILITNLTNIYYLTGFSGTSATLLLTSKRRLLITDARYSLIAKACVSDFDIIESRTPLEVAAKVLKEDGLKSLAFENQVPFSFYQSLEAVFAGLELLPQSQWVEQFRLIKDQSEIETIAKACSISDKAFIDVLDFIKPGQTSELEVANFLDFRMRHYGATGVSFETIAASGERSAIPHGVASSKIIQ
ncbi:creatinase [Streptococcus ictaluri 707-05]|uniref:Creatinase n=1 Tax=Streptococcus ictaluri 707-05 TaxID=764299 RepID=G5JZW9_9STRE|nr:creatinase [Streptococcus ictaluri 707-05]